MHALRLSRRRGTLLAADFVMVRQCPQLHAVGLGALGQGFRGQGAVRDDRVAVQVCVENVLRAHKFILGPMPKQGTKGVMDPRIREDDGPMRSPNPC